MKSIFKKLKKSNGENIPIASGKTKAQKKTVLFKFFIVLSIIITVFLFPFVFELTSRFPDAYAKNEADFKEISLETANKTAIFVWPLLIGYITLLVALIVKKTDSRKVYYPLAALVFMVFAFCLGVVYYDMIVMWYIIIYFREIIALLAASIIVGIILDIAAKQKRKPQS